jgi:hypothetical protein
MAGEDGEHDGSHIAAMGREGRMLLTMTTGYTRSRHVASAGHIAANDPAWVLEDVAAKREILALHRSERWNADDGPDADHCAECTTDDDLYKPQMYPCQTVRLLARPWISHPDHPEHVTEAAGPASGCSAR